MRKIMQHRLLALLAMLMISLVSLASQPQGRKHHDGFDPKRFQAELEQYHSRFMTILPPNKVFSVIKAEERFHRQAFRRMKK